MATTQDVEAGVRPGGVAPVNFNPPPQPVQLPTPMPEAAQLPAGTAGGISPAAVPTVTPPKPIVLDRQAYLAAQQKLDQIRSQIAPVLNTVQHYQQLGAAHTWAQNPTVNVTDFGYDPNDARTWQPALDRANAEALRRSQAGIQHVQVVPPGEAGNNALLRGYGALGTALTTEIPGAKAVQSAAGTVARAAAAGPSPLDLIPGVNTQTIRQKIAGTVAESLIPTQVWTAALTLIPAAKARTIPELIGAITIGDTDAITALRNAGKRLGESDAVERTLGQLGSEAGMAKIPKLPFGKNPLALPAGQTVAETFAKGPIEPVGAVSERLSKELSPSDQAALQINDWLFKGEKVRPEQRVMFSQQRALQAQKMEEVYRAGGTSSEAMAAGGGKFARPFLAPLELTPEGEQALRQEIRASTIMGFPANKAIAERALDAMKAGVLPQPNEAIQLSKIVGGPDFLMMIEKRAPRDWKKEFLGVLGVPQALQSGGDISAVFRQMAPLGFGNPAEYVDSIGTIGRAARSWESAKAVQAETEALPWITSAPNAEADALGINFRDLGGRMADIGGHLHESEGQFSAINRSVASKAVEKLPLYQMSERVYNVPINRERGLIFSKFAQNMWDAGERNPDRFKALANVVDHASGWSNATPGQIAEGLNAFYSVRNMMARFQVLLDPILQPGSLLKPSARNLAARNLVGFVSANAAMLGMMAGSGALAAKTMGIPNPVHVELDPRSSSSFTGRIGSALHLDMTGGFGSIIRLVARLAPMARLQAPQIKTPGGNIIKGDPAQLVDDFIAGKLGPVPKIVWNALGFPGGEAYAADFKSNKGLRTAALNLLTPFFVQDVVEAWRQEGAKGALIAGPVSFLGGGVSAYQQSAAGQRSDAILKFEDNVLNPAGARIAKNEVGDITLNQAVWPTQLDKDYKSVAWQTLFEKDFTELGDFSQYATLAEARKAYVDYWAPKTPDMTKDEISAAFGKFPSTKLWAKNVTLERTRLYAAHPAIIPAARKLNVDTPEAPK